MLLTCTFELFPLIEMQSCGEKPLRLAQVEEVALHRMFEGDSYIATRDRPVINHNILRIPSVYAICVHSIPLGVGGRAHIEVGHGDVLRIGNKCMPAILVSHSFLNSIYLFPFLRLRLEYSLKKQLAIVDSDPMEK